MKNMKAMIFAAGLGTRLKPITDTLPKALVPVCGHPLLEHVSRKLMASGITEAVVNVHHFADKVEEWIGSQDWICRDAADMEEGKMLLQVSDERSGLLETGGAILHARPYLEGCGNFLIHNVDILSDCNLPWLISEVRPDALATLLVSERKSSRYLIFDKETMRLAGWVNTKTGETRPAGLCADGEEYVKLAFSGIHIMSDKILEVMEAYAADNGTYVPSGQPRFPIMDFYLDICSSHEVYGVKAESLELLDVGKLDAIAPAEEFVRMGKDKVQ